MRNEHNGSHRPGDHKEPTDYTDHTDFIPRKPHPEPDGHACPFSRNSKARCLAWEAGGLTPALRCFAYHHNWHAPGPFTNRIKLRLAFKKPILEAVNTLLADRREGMAAKIEKDFSKLQKTVRDLDRMCGGRQIDEDDELVMLEHTKAHLAESLCDLAEMLECGQEPLENPPEPQTEWTTAAEAGEILGMHPGTVRRWAREGKIRDNGKTGRNRRVSKMEILLIKQAAEEKDRQKDLDELRRDARRIK